MRTVPAVPRRCAALAPYFAGIGSDGDTVMDGGTNELVECLTRIQVEVLTLGVAHEESLPFK